MRKAGFCAAVCNGTLATQGLSGGQPCAGTFESVGGTPVLKGGLHAVEAGVLQKAGVPLCAPGIQTPPLWDP